MSMLGLRVHTFKYANPEPLTDEQIEAEVAEKKAAWEKNPDFNPDVLETFRRIQKQQQERLQKERWNLDGFLQFTPAVFGIHCVVSAYGGENLYTLIGTGGHITHALLIRQRVDSPIESFKLGPHCKHEEVVKQFLNLMPLNLAKSVHRIFSEMKFGEGELQHNFVEYNYER